MELLFTTSAGTLNLDDALTEGPDAAIDALLSALRRAACMRADVETSLVFVGKIEALLSLVWIVYTAESSPEDMVLLEEDKEMIETLEARRGLPSIGRSFHEYGGLSALLMLIYILRQSEAKRLKKHWDTFTTATGRKWWTKQHHVPPRRGDNRIFNLAKKVRKWIMDQIIDHFSRDGEPLWIRTLREQLPAALPMAPQTDPTVKGDGKRPIRFIPFDSKRLKTEHAEPSRSLELGSPESETIMWSPTDSADTLTAPPKSNIEYVPPAGSPTIDRPVTKSTVIEGRYIPRDGEVPLAELLSHSNPGPQFQLPMRVMVSDTALSIRYAMEGNIDGLRNLFDQGLASPWDVSISRGFTLIRWALYGGMHNYKMVQYLRDAGASVDNDSYTHFWDYAFRRNCSTVQLAELKCILLDPPRTYEDVDWVEEQKFPLIHEIILGRSKKPLIDELGSNPDAVRAKDTMGRTALDWATARAQLPQMSLLIERGSSVNTMDVSGRTTILHAVDSHNDDALRILLEAGADPNPEVPKGRFRSSPLTAASFGDLEEMIKLLLKFKAKVDACNPEGRTALQVVASKQNVKCADILLSHGADIGHISSNGHSPLTTAIMHNSHALLRLFIERYDTSRLDRFQLLPVIVEFADAETVSILASSDLLQNSDGFAAGREILRSRRDYDEKMGDAFEEFFRQGQQVGSQQASNPG